MTMHIEVERLVLQDLPVAPGDRRRLLAAVEQAIRQQLTAQPPQWQDGTAVPVLRPSPITLPGTPDGSIGALANGIAGATTGAVTQLAGGKP